MPSGTANANAWSNPKSNRQQSKGGRASTKLDHHDMPPSGHNKSVVTAGETVSSAQQSAVTSRRVKGPNEDAWLSTAYDDPDFDRSRLESLRRVALNPDLLRVRNFHCYCGNDVIMDEHWCVMTNDGTLVCNDCARCHCCDREAKPISRRLVSIDGMVLCYRCVRFFGHKRRPKFRMRIETLASKDPFADKEKTDKSTSDSTAIANLSNSEYYEYNVPRTTRCGYTPKDDKRKLFRPRYYSPPVKALAPEDDPCVVPPIYLAENLGQPAMQCPVCKNVALGPKAYVVPAMARVYHRHCFRCSNCKESLAYGYKLAGIAFQYCSCDVPVVWCCKPACRTARHAHHNATKCHLGCIRPGGRIQADYTVEPRPDQDTVHRRKRAKKGQKVAANSQKLSDFGPPVGQSNSSNEVSLQTDATLLSSSDRFREVV